MTFVFVLAGIAILGVVAMVASGSGDGLDPPKTDRPDPWLPIGRPVSGADLRQLRFSVGFRGYRMDEVDRLLERLDEEITLRDALIDELESQPGGALTTPYAAPEHALPEPLAWPLSKDEGAPG